MEEINFDKKVYGYFIGSDSSTSSTEFISSEDDPQQLGTVSRKEGEKINSHRHTEKSREILKTQETIFLRSGRALVTVFDDGEELESFELTEGDVISLLRGGHSVEFLSDTDMVVVKQGPYLGEDDKEFS